MAGMKIKHTKITGMHIINDNAVYLGSKMRNCLHEHDKNILNVPTLCVHVTFS